MSSNNADRRKLVKTLSGRVIRDVILGRRGELVFKAANGDTLFSVSSEEHLFDRDGNFFNTDDVNVS